MKTITPNIWRTFASFCLVIVCTEAHGGRIIAAFDDWTLADIGFHSPADPGVFATNIANWFVPGRSGNFLAHSTHPGFAGNLLAESLVSAGHKWKVDVSQPFTLANLVQYDAVFVGGDAVDTNMLIRYVEAGGNVYVFSGGNTESGKWNGFLSRFGLAFTGSGTSGQLDYSISSAHELFAGVDALFGWNGNGDGDSVEDLNLSSSTNQVLVTDAGSGLFAVWDEGFPTSPRPDFRIRKISEDEVQLSWKTVTNLDYQLEFSESATAGQWNPLGAPLSGTGESFSTNDMILPQRPQRFYRLSITDVP
jgi:hypothetical protein